MKDKGRKSLRRKFNDRARRASLAAVSTLAMLGASGCATTDKATAEPVKVTQTAPAPPAAPPPPKPAVPYDYDIFEQNAAGLPPSTLLPLMSQEERRQYLMSKLCFSAGAKPGEERRQKELFEALDDLSKIKITGGALVDLAVQEKLKVCAVQHLPAGVAAQYLPSLDAVVATPQEPREERALKMAHEILHAAQGQHALLSHGRNWSIESRVQGGLSTEAAAQAVEFLAAFEAHVAGDDRYWHYIQGLGGTTYSDTDIYKQMQDTYDGALKSAKTHEEALRLAGRAAFVHVFESTGWRNFYLNLELQSYLSDVAYDAFLGKGAPEAGFTQAGVDFAGLVQGKGSFTAGAAIPGGENLIGRDKKMYWAYQAVDIARHEQAYGVFAPETVALFNKAVADANPYLAVDIKELYAETVSRPWTEPRKYRYVYEALDAMAAAKNQPIPAPRKAETPRPQPRPPGFERSTP